MQKRTTVTFSSSLSFLSNWTLLCLLLFYRGYAALRPNGLLAGKSSPESSTNGARGSGLVVAWASSASHWGIPRGEKKGQLLRALRTNPAVPLQIDMSQSAALRYTAGLQILNEREKSQILERMVISTVEVDARPGPHRS